MHCWIKMTTKESKEYKVHGRNLIAPRYGYRYIGTNLNRYSNYSVKMVEYQIDTLPILQHIIDSMEVR